MQRAPPPPTRYSCSIFCTYFAITDTDPRAGPTASTGKAKTRRFKGTLPGHAGAIFYFQNPIRFSAIPLNLRRGKGQQGPWPFFGFSSVPRMACAEPLQPIGCERLSTPHLGISTVWTINIRGAGRQPEHIRRERSTPSHVHEHRGTDTEMFQRADIAASKIVLKAK